MDIEDDPVNVIFQAKMTVWPKTVKEIENFIKRAESLLDDLKIDLDAAKTSSGDDSAITALRGRHDTVLENLEASKEDPFCNFSELVSALSRAFCRIQHSEDYKEGPCCP
ncbi:hypothetical protein H1R20_g9038, partial [Candolleomyces eurysporus]